ncbi:MAG: ComEC/Rec2 family competence protein [Rhodobacteraceae bacterium]|nr:ComEC/Rec2 family competence protein [Paracoccaceae bacterium]
MGIGLYFSLAEEPAAKEIAVVIVIAVFVVIAARLSNPAFAPLLYALALVCFGAGLASLRAHLVAAPVLGWNYYGPIEGRVVAIDRSSSDALRLTLDEVVLARFGPEQTPQRVRFSLQGDQRWHVPEPGERVMTTGYLGPPPGPSSPGGFDFRRTAWFDRLGAVGYTRNPLLLAEPAEEGDGLWLSRLRRDMAGGIEARIGGEAGAFAAAVTTGDRSAMSLETTRHLRVSNLAHLLAISGLHMGLLTGVVFAGSRLGFNLWPGLALRLPVKKLAALAALLAGAAYLALSGGSVSTLRAFVMVAVMYVAVLIDRRAITLRGVAIAALIILVLRPEELLGPGFQMSFAATIALVGVYGRWPVLGGRLPGWARPIAAVLFASVVAGAATAPFAAAHFNLFPRYGLLANVLSVPVMGAVVAPGGVAAALGWLVGLEALGLWIMEMGLRWILWIAGSVAALPAAVGGVKAPAALSVPLLAFGSLVVLLWVGRFRWSGAVLVALGLVLWIAQPRPDLLIADSGGLVGVMTPEGRALSKPSGDGFSASNWLEDDGDIGGQERAASRGDFEREGRVVRFFVGSQPAILVTGKVASAALSGCGGAEILISNQRLAPDRPCLSFDLGFLATNGAVALSVRKDGSLQITTAREVSGRRLWTGSDQ